MAPEVIEQSGATTASDIWFVSAFWVAILTFISVIFRSVGCVVIELLEGKPPYHNLDPMPAMFRIVQDDCPPIPEGASPIVKDFLYHCFQKDCNLRISARKLLKHPWMVSARRQMNDGKLNGRGKANDPDGTKRPLSNYNYDEAVLKVQEWNEALKCMLAASDYLTRSPNIIPAPSRPSKHTGRGQNSVFERPASPVPSQDYSPALPASTSVSSQTSSGSSGWKIGSVPSGINLVEKIREPLAFVLRPPEVQTDNWDDDFEEGISFTKIQGYFHFSNNAALTNVPFKALEKTSLEEEKPEVEDNAQTIRPNRSPSLLNNLPLAAAPSPDIVPIVEDYSDLLSGEDELSLQDKVADFKVSFIAVEHA